MKKPKFKQGDRIEWCGLKGTVINTLPEFESGSMKYGLRLVVHFDKPIKRIYPKGYIANGVDYPRHQEVVGANFCKKTYVQIVVEKFEKKYNL